MFVERFFATRQRLTDVIVEVRRLGEECETDVSALADEGDFLKELNRPFLFMVCGEVNAGKSSLLNGLFGSEISPSHDLPKTKKVVWYRYGKAAKVIKKSPFFEESHQSHSFLRDFNLVDTPGTDGAEGGHLAMMERFVPVVDLLFVVFPVSNPWGAATWQFVSKLPEDVLRNTAFILQQCDQKEPEDIEVIVGHMKSLAEQKTGISPTVYPVSGKAALDAKINNPGSIHSLRKSGYPTLEAFISRTVSGNPDRRRVMQAVHDSTQIALERIEEQIESRRSTLDHDQRFLAELENEVDARREGQAKQLSGRLAGLGDVFLRQGIGAKDLLSARMSLLQSLFSLFQREKIPTFIERGLTEAVKTAVEEQAGKDGVELVTNCRAHWETVVPRIAENLAVSAPDFDKETDSLNGTRERFVQRLGRSAKQGVTQLKIRSTLEQQMEGRRTVLRRFMIAILILLSAAGVTGALELDPWPLAAIASAGAMLLIAGFYSVRSRKRVCGDFLEQIENLQQIFSDSLAEDYQDGVREFYLEYGGLFVIVRRRIADQKRLLKPRLKRWNDLFLELKAVEQEI